MKVFIPDQILAEWFIKSLLPKITKDVAKGGVVIEEQVIAQAQYLDLVYTQSGTLYEKKFDLPCPIQITLIGFAAKWYIKLPSSSFNNFNALATTSVTHFHFPVRYDNGIEILTSLKQSTSTYILDHIHEWRCR